MAFAEQMTNQPCVHEFWKDAGFARPCRQHALSAGCVPREHFQPSGRLPGAATPHMRADKKHWLPKPGFKNDDPVSSQACVGQTPLPLKCSIPAVSETGVVVYFAARRASTAWSKHSNAGFPLCTKDSGQNKAGMSWVTGFWALVVTYVQQRQPRAG